MASNIFFGGITINPTEEARNRTITMALMLALGAGAENVSSGGGGMLAVMLLPVTYGFNMGLTWVSNG